MTITRDELDFVRTLVRTHTGVDLDESKSYLVESRLQPILKDCGFASASDLLRAMRERKLAQLQQTIIDAMMTHETMFFRDDRPFECLRQHILPNVIERRRKEQHLRIWNAACSSGQEPYSVAMLIHEHFPEVLTWDFKLFASDVSQGILGKARQGCYTQFEVSRGLSEDLLKRYFTQTGKTWTIRKDIRSLVTFFELNLIHPLPDLPIFDVILMRNVLIYFTPDKKVEILNRVSKNLHPEGYLMLGGSETAVGLTTNLERVHVGNSDCYRLIPSMKVACGT